MLGRGGHADKRIATTVAFILKCPASTVPQAMQACKFSDKESKHAGMQMAVRRARAKALAGKKRPPPKCDYQRIKIREEVHVPADQQHRPIITVDARRHEIDMVITKVGKGKAKGESHPKELTGNAEGAGE
jgi:hypothetical protein